MRPIRQASQVFPTSMESSPAAISGPTGTPLNSATPSTVPTSKPDRKSTRLNSSHTEIYTLSLHDALPIFSGFPDQHGEQPGGDQRPDRHTFKQRHAKHRADK